MKYGKVVEGNLEITKDCKDDFSEVVEVKGYIIVRQGATLQLPNLETCGGDISLDEGATLQADKNVIKNVTSDKARNAKQFTFKFTFDCFLKLGFVWADNILTKLISKKSDKNRNTIYKTQAIGRNKILFVIESNGVFSHGKTLKEAKDSLIYKISNRDTSMYKDYTLDTVITFEDAIKMYRCITGACEAGTRNFVENVLKDKRKRYKISEVIKLTKGQYNNEKLAEFFNVKSEV